MRLANKYVEPTDLNILVIHRDPGRYSHFVKQTDAPLRYVVGRSMYETDRIPDDWVQPCNEVVREIWVPSQFNVETFSHSGVQPERLFKVPEPMDIHTYDPDIIEPLSLPNRNAFAFLSVMKWEKRKGWDLLLRAYLEEFSSSDNISLYLRSNLDTNNLAEFESFMENTTNEIIQSNPRKTFPQNPQIVTALLPYMGMPSLYKSVDCLVQPSHGEGWGLPIVEAMAMGLPTIATNWSGSTEFMRENNSYLIEVEALVNATRPEHLWALPSLSHLRQLMRRVYKNQSEAKQVGMNGMEWIHNYYSQEIVADMVVEHLKRIKEKVEKEREETRANPQPGIYNNRSPIENLTPPTEAQASMLSPKVKPAERTKMKMKIVN